MREARKTQHSLRENWLDLGHANELRTISRLLDDHPKIAGLFDDNGVPHRDLHHFSTAFLRMLFRVPGAPTI